MKNKVNSLWLLASYNFININAETVLVKGITFSTSKFGGVSVTSDEHFVLKTGLNIEKYLFKNEKSKDLFKNLIDCIKQNNDLYNDLKTKCNSTFKDLKIENPEDIDNFFNNFYYDCISDQEYGGSRIRTDNINKDQLYLNLERIQKINYEIENKEKINDGVIKSIEKFFNEYLNDNTNYPFNVKNMLEFYEKQLDDSRYSDIKDNKVNFSIYSKKIFYDIKNLCNKAGIIPKDLYINFPLELKISLDTKCKIYKTNLVFYVNENKKDTLLVEENYDLKDFNIENYKYLFINRVQYYLNLKDGDFTIEKNINNRDVNIKITKPSAIRYEITDEVDNKYVIYSGNKLTEREIVAILEKNEPEKYVLYENLNRVDVNKKLENEKYEMKYSAIVYRVKFTDKYFKEFHFYKKATYNELKNVYKKDLTDDTGLSKVEYGDISDPNIILEPGDYHFISSVKKKKENDEKLEKAKNDGETIIMDEKKAQYSCCR